MSEIANVSGGADSAKEHLAKPLAEAAVILAGNPEGRELILSLRWDAGQTLEVAETMRRAAEAIRGME